MANPNVQPRRGRDNKNIRPSRPSQTTGQGLTSVTRDSNSPGSPSGSTNVTGTTNSVGGVSGTTNVTGRGIRGGSKRTQ